MLGRGEMPDFASFLRDWRASRMVWNGSRVLSLWRGPEDARIAVLCDSQPDWRVVSAADFSLSKIWARPQPRHRSFQLPGDPQGGWGDCLCRHGVFLGWWPALDAARGLRLIRRDQPVTLSAEAGEFVLIDWQDPAPVDRFIDIDLPAQGWTSCVASWVPYAAAQVWSAYARDAALWRAERQTADQWARSVFDEGGADWIDRVIAVLSAADADRDRDTLVQCGAHIYGNDAVFFRRLGAAISSGTLNPEVVGLVLSMERPEYFDPETLAVFRRLQGRCGEAR